MVYVCVFVVIHIKKPISKREEKKKTVVGCAAVEKINADHILIHKPETSHESNFQTFGLLFHDEMCIVYRALTHQIMASW